MWELDYKDLYQFSLEHPDKFWDEVAKDVIWSKPYDSVLEDKHSTSPRWFVGGELNMSYNCLDRQVEDGYGDEVAVIHDSPITGSIQKLTYNDLLKEVQLLAGVMRDRCGLVKGDKVLLYFPMIPQCLVAMLACTRIGVTYTTVYGGFAVKEMALRIGYFEPKLIIASNVGLEPGTIVNYKEKMTSAISQSGFTPDFLLVFNRPNYPAAILTEENQLDWHTELRNATPVGITPVESNHPMFVAFTSGTTGEPKGIVKSTGGAVVSNKYGIKYILGVKPRETIWIMSDFSWIAGQTMLSYGPLMGRSPTIIYEGKLIGTPDSGQFNRVLNAHRVVCVFSVTTNMKILRQSCSPEQLQLNYGDLRCIMLGGEISDPTITNWTSTTFQCPVYNFWSQTELGGGGIGPGLGLKNSWKYLHDKALGLPMPTFKFKIVDRDSGIELPNGTVGRILLMWPSSPSSIVTLYKDHERFVRTYLSRCPGYFDTMDTGMITEDGLLKVVARDDDIIHVGAIRISGSAIEEVCITLVDVLDVAVVPLVDSVKGQVPFAFLVVKDNISSPQNDIIDEAIDKVRDSVGEVASFNKAIIVPGLPKTISGKTVRSSLGMMLNCNDFKTPSTVVNPEVYSQIHEVLIRHGYVVCLPH